MKKLLMPVIGIGLFVAGYQHTRRQTEYITAQAALANKPAYVAAPVSAPVMLKNSLAFRLMNPS